MSKGVEMPCICCKCPRLSCKHNSHHEHEHEGDDDGENGGEDSDAESADYQGVDGDYGDGYGDLDGREIDFDDDSEPNVFEEEE